MVGPVLDPIFDAAELDALGVGVERLHRVKDPFRNLCVQRFLRELSVDLERQ